VTRRAFGIAVIGAVVMAAEFGSTAVNAADPDRRSDDDDLPVSHTPRQPSRLERAEA
jgi:hypothetical protein